MPGWRTACGELLCPVCGTTNYVRLKLWTEGAVTDQQAVDHYASVMGIPCGECDNRLPGSEVVTPETFWIKDLAVTEAWSGSRS